MLAHLATRRLFGAGISTYATSSTRTSNGLWSSPSVTPASPRCLFHSPCRRPLLIRPRSSLLSVRHSVRFKSEVTAKVQRQPILRKIYNTFAYIGFFIISGGVVILGLFIYDATTYREEPSIQDCTVSELALSPRRGGPKNLPIAEHLLDDNDSEAKKAQQDKPRLVILGTGWGSTALLKTLNPGDYHVTVVSPVGYFLFTPMLPSATVGTLSLRTLVEPARRIVQRVNGHFLKGQAEDVDFENRLVEVSQEDANGNRRHFYLPYDKLVIAVGTFRPNARKIDSLTRLIEGSLTNAHGVEGLEHCHFLKTIDDARMIKNKITQNMELACLPTTSDEERRRLLSFVICGGGPTGVEFAAELYDLLNEDLIQKFPRILRNEISVHVIQSRSHILNTYDEALSLYAEVRLGTGKPRGREPRVADMMMYYRIGSRAILLMS